MKNLINFFKGMVIGIANIIPGVSGGTMAVVLNIYDKLISSVSDILKGWKKNLIFLLPIGIGAGTGIVVFSKLIKTLLETKPIPTNFFFIGLIIGSIPMIGKKALESKFKISSIIPFVITFGILIALSVIMPPEANVDIIRKLTVNSFIQLLLAGIVGASAMVVPGISGSFILLLIGLYTTVITAVAEFNIPLLIPIGIGVIIGIIFTTKIIDKLLNKFPQPTYFAILGLVIGSVFSIYPGFVFNGDGIIAIIAMISGIILAYFLGSDRK
ncbi:MULTISPECIES: DUF368 domain-containing protein [Clostridium]|uniref:DUF368 domain-containing protein n=1 Tax=Clostridium faecium TaxID=2762223 RepID=A0ABR8YQ51_9CLOT|nr:MULTISPECIES: DUF368 domain-containing protein [Clostridium]MBD8046368.1 DUF368 domain-containing protein [Clostridium faecium]MDU1349365.1 DUF368 domain-containing protein [Clostridium argentinense]